MYPYSVLCIVSSHHLAIVPVRVVPVLCQVKEFATARHWMENEKWSGSCRTRERTERMKKFFPFDWYGGMQLIPEDDFGRSTTQ
jgi:hypothetical protein